MIKLFTSLIWQFQNNTVLVIMIIFNFALLVFIYGLLVFIYGLLRDNKRAWEKYFSELEKKWEGEE